MKQNIFTHLKRIFNSLMWSVSSTRYLTPYKALVLFHLLCENRNAVFVAVLGFRSITKQLDFPLYDRERIKTT